MCPREPNHLGRPRSGMLRGLRGEMRSCEPGCESSASCRQSSSGVSLLGTCSESCGLSSSSFGVCASTFAPAPGAAPALGATGVPASGGVAAAVAAAARCVPTRPARSPSAPTSLAARLRFAAGRSRRSSRSSSSVELIVWCSLPSAPMPSFTPAPALSSLRLSLLTSSRSSAMRCFFELRSFATRSKRSSCSCSRMVATPSSLDMSASRSSTSFCTCFSRLAASS
mmetsp:Transcript_8306/g.33616  ORF Transcript_8306/g.33616 Transcript_8306/m.33616 type:complete len:226 (-) Transcript_8306:13-690(-)